MCALAARLTFFPRLDDDKWATFRSVLLKDQADAAIETLIDIQVLQDERFSTYGHDTRHAAARRWFIKYRHALIRRVSEQLIEAIASHITGRPREVELPPNPKDLNDVMREMGRLNWVALSQP